MLQSLLSNKPLRIREFLVFRCWMLMDPAAHFWGLPLACHQFSYDEWTDHAAKVSALMGFFASTEMSQKGVFVCRLFFFWGGGQIINQQNHHTSMMMTPIGSMGLVYIPTWMVDFYGKCWWINHTWILWDIASRKCGSLLFFFRNLRFVAWNLHLEIRRFLLGSEPFSHVSNVNWRGPSGANPIGKEHFQPAMLDHSLKCGYHT